MFCEQCGNKIEDNAAFCEICGTKVIAESDTPKIIYFNKGNGGNPSNAPSGTPVDNSVNNKEVAPKPVYPKEKPVKVKPATNGKAKGAIIFIVILIIATLGAGFFFIGMPMIKKSIDDKKLAEKSDDSEETDESDGKKSDDKSGKGGDSGNSSNNNSANNDSGEKEDLPNVTISVYDANSSTDGANNPVGNVSVCIKKGDSDNNGGEIVVTLKTGNDGAAGAKLDPGVYTVEYSTSGYCNAYDYIEVKDELHIDKYIPKVEQSDENMLIVLEWKGNHDLDLCFTMGVNGGKEEFYSASGKAAANDGSGVFSDNKRSTFEMMRIVKYDKSVKYGVHVVDCDAVKNGTSSSMEKEGAVISVYISGECAYRFEADPSMDTQTWNPFVVLKQVLIDNNTVVYYNASGGNDWPYMTKTN